MHHHFVLLIVSLPPSLLANYPDASASSRRHLGRFFANDELKTGHGPEAGFESLAGLNVVVHGHVVHGLAHDYGVVGGALEERRLSEVEEDGV